MLGLPLTYEILAQSRNEAAVDALVQVLGSNDPASREFAIQTLRNRTEPQAAQAVVGLWDNLNECEQSKLASHRDWLLPTVQAIFEEGGDQLPIAIDIARSLGMTAAFPHLILLAESSIDQKLKTAATKAVLSLVAPLGLAAREDRDQPSVRRPILDRLLDSLRTFSRHRNPHLLDAFMMASTWGDGSLRGILSTDCSERSLLRKRLANTKQPTVIDLLAGFIRRRKVDDSILALIRDRQDVAFRHALLNQIGTKVSTSVQHNLREIGLPRCFVAGRPLIGELPPEQHAALLIAHSIASKKPLGIMHLAVEAIAGGGPGTIAAAAHALSRCDTPDIDFWMRAAVPVADANEEEIAADENAQLIQGLIDLLDHCDAGIVRGVKRVLGPMHAEAMLPRMQILRPRSRRRLGRVVMMIDSEAVERVSDALRHPVLEKRMEAIAMADALAIVDLLSVSFAHITQEDHQEARRMAAEVLGNAESDETLDLLEEMLRLPASSVRDTAAAAVEKRSQAPTHKSLHGVR